MPKTLRSPRHVRLIDLLVEQRNRAGLSQADLAEKLGRYQSVVSQIESGGRRVDVVELLDIAAIIGLDVHALIDDLLSTRQITDR
ncbi:helix-turn-helix domain-containing protein [Sphingomonas sp. CCH5-D11]|uniref:helix-turn-helix domain-containing protein n=1 Tax=Sphingomonas sp. CCH5-D11 TaxID=1768786 RepID=UPI0009EB116E